MKNTKRAAALICVIILAALYIFTLIAALLDFPGSGNLFRAALGTTIGLPILLWIYIQMGVILKQKKADSGKTGAEEWLAETESEVDNRKESTDLGGDSQEPPLPH